MRALPLALATLCATIVQPTLAETGRAEDSKQAVSAGNAFNPAISLILSGNYYGDSENGKLLAPAGINGRETEVADQGLNLDETELVMSATVDPDFDAMANIVLKDGAAEVEEAWFETRRLPYGLKVRAGKMKSNIGYLNSQHPHTWDFADPNLACAALLGGEGIADVGLRMEWLPDLPLYTLLGMEALQGKQEVVGVAQAELDPASALTAPEEKNGPRLFTAYVKVAPELGDSLNSNHTLQLGLWGLHAAQQQETYGTPGADEYLLDGDENIYGFEAVYKYDGGGEAGHGNLKLQAEILRGQKNLAVAALAGAPVYNNGNTVNQDDAVVSVETAYYIQAVYGIAPRWQTGLRFDQAGLGSDISEAGVNTAYSASKRASAVLTWNLTEFSRLRAQVARADVVDTSNTSQTWNQYFLSYTMSLGTHGAHKF